MKEPAGTATLLSSLHASDFLKELLKAFRAFDWPKVTVHPAPKVHPTFVFPCNKGKRNRAATVQFRIQFLDGNAAVILDLIADARNAADAIELVADIDWPPHAVTMRVLDLDGRQVHSAVKGAGGRLRPKY